MSELIEVLLWDSEFFGLSIGRVRLVRLNEESIAVLLAEAQQHSLRCLYFEANPDDPETVAVAEKYQFSLVDVRVVLEHPFDNRPSPVPRYPVPPELMITGPRVDEVPRLSDIAAQIGHTSRFAFDPKFPAGYSERLYRVWIENACRGFAQAVLIARCGQAGDAVGLITCTLHDHVAHIQLAGVHRDHRQKSVGTGLVQAALDWARTHDTSRMQVVTQARNVPAQRLYQQMGFFTRSMSLYYHKWL